MRNFDLQSFIDNKITNRKESIFQKDLTNNQNTLAEAINSKSVLVIGGAGTIGSSYIKALLRFKPSKLVVVDINENQLTELVRDIRSSADLHVPKDFITYPINFSDSVFAKIFDSHKGFDIVANFAAHKHVRSEKDIFSIEALIRNNVINAKYLLDQILQYPPRHFFCVSTDKAANPVNIMGASKKIMEELILSYSRDMKVTTARFANVAFSNGSLLAGFVERIMKRQPLSSPTDIKRYFVSPRESGELCLLACILGKSANIFFPKISEEEMKTFSEIAKDFLEYCGFTPRVFDTEEDAKAFAETLNENSIAYPLHLFKSVTSGEKAFEEFFTNEEKVDMQALHAIGIIDAEINKSKNDMNEFIRELNEIFDANSSKKEIVEFLSKKIDTFNHIETGMNLDQKM
ncbi:polysaccharide biosynthesis protein [Chitinophaga barathri]|uniref:NAD-dependent epimerase/dehydratase family protein n=1 Tax=Chitinophaga barathri TaxID=1647451 RepID=A0A3N4MAH1_9BACT|nr:polysaccharide biosynthesis protein [Chitinophaga barathri]RPD40478.1 NAD-dependent epimerase/dehydratase family protein [Chitinophaga barathri]